MGVPMSTSIAIAGIRKRNSHALRNDAMSGVWIRKLGRSISGANSSRITRNTPASFGFKTIISSLNKSRLSSRIRTTNRLPNNSLTKAFIQLRYLKANKPTDRNGWKTKEIPKKIRDLFTLLGLPLPPRVFRD